MDDYNPYAAAYLYMYEVEIEKRQQALEERKIRAVVHSKKQDQTLHFSLSFLCDFCLTFLI